jgi:hypothetical protein
LAHGLHHVEADVQAQGVQLYLYHFHDKALPAHHHRRAYQALFVYLLLYAEGVERPNLYEHTFFQSLKEDAFELDVAFEQEYLLLEH